MTKQQPFLELRTITDDRRLLINPSMISSVCEAAGGGSVITMQNGYVYQVTTPFTHFVGRAIR
jgi:hypothetical protein